MHQVQGLLREVLQERLQGKAYDPMLCSALSKQLAGALHGCCRCCAHQLPKGAQSGAGCWLHLPFAASSCSPPHPNCPASDDIRERVKALGLDRHKLLVQVTCGENKGQALNVASRCLWDTTTDGYASEAYQGESVFCSASVFALYFE